GGLEGAARAAGRADLARREQLPARGEEVVLHARRVVLRVVVALDRQLVFAEPRGDLLRGPAGRDVGGLGLVALLRGVLGGLEEAEQRRRSVDPARTGVQDVRLPVVELELGGGADLLLGAGGVGDTREADRDLVGALLLDLGLGDA